MSTTRGRDAVEALLPHRDPFLFVDAYERDATGAVRATWRVPEDAAWFQGHYPGQPVLPGVLICEHAMQAGALLVALELGGLASSDGVPVVTRLSDARFRRMVRPGATLETTVELVARTGPAFELRARVKEGGARVAELTCVLAASDALARATGKETSR